MKKLFSIALIMIIAALLSSCAAKTSENTVVTKEVTVKTTEQTQDVLSHFKGFKTLDDVLAETGEVDFYLKPDYSGLTKKTQKGDESASALECYYSGDTLVYAVHSGAGEETVEYFFTSKKGNALKAIYVDKDDIRESVSVEAEDYSASFNLLNKKSKYGADDIQVSIFNKDENDFPAILNYSIKKEKAFVSSANYYDNSGYHYYTAYIDENNKLCEENYLKFKKKESIKPFSKLKAFCQNPNVRELDVLMGSGEFCYTENESGEKTWFYHGSIYAVFSDRYKAYDFAKQNNLDVRRDEDDEDYWIAEIKDEFFEFSQSFEGFYDLAAKEINDCYYASVKADKNGKIKELEDSELTYCR